MKVLPLWWGAVVLALAGLTGCGFSSSSSAPPTLPLPATAPPLPTAPVVVAAPAATPTVGTSPPVSALPGLTTVASTSIEAAVSGFCDAVTAGRPAEARAYLTPAFQTRTATTPLPRLLGVQNTPASYLYRIDSETASHATSTVTFQFAAGNVVDSMALTHTASGWLINAISPTTG